MLCLGMHSNVMLRFKVQALQVPPLCSSTVSKYMYQTLWTVEGAWAAAGLFLSCRLPEESWAQQALPILHTLLLLISGNRAVDPEWFILVPPGPELKTFPDPDPRRDSTLKTRRSKKNLKGTVSRDFLLQYFSWIILPPGGRPENNENNIRDLGKTVSWKNLKLKILWRHPFKFQHGDCSSFF